MRSSITAPRVSVYDSSYSGHLRESANILRHFNLILSFVPHGYTLKGMDTRPGCVPETSIEMLTEELEHLVSRSFSSTASDDFWHCLDLSNIFFQRMSKPWAKSFTFSSFFSRHSGFQLISSIFHQYFFFTIQWSWANVKLVILIE